MGAEGSKQLLRQLINVWKIKRNANPAYIVYLMERIFLVLEDTYSVGTVEELQSAIDEIGTESGTIFIESGTYEITVPIDIDNCGSLVIYGHGDNTILKPVDGITVFNITCCASLLVKTLKIDASNYTAPSVDVELVIVNETNDNVVSFSDVTFAGVNRGRGFDLISENCIIENCNIHDMSYGILLTGDHQLIVQNKIASCEIGIYAGGLYHTITGNTVNNHSNLAIYVQCSYSNVSNNICTTNPSGISLNGANNNTIANNTCASNTFNGIRTILSSYNTISGNTCNDNDSNLAGGSAGIFIDANCDYNTISANSCNNNNNAGAGDAMGIFISAATCNENIVAANNCNGNDIDFFDAGTDTTIEYFVQDEEELQDAVDSIGSKSGIINIEGSFTIAAPIDIDNAAIHRGSYIIRGDGSNTTLTPSGNFNCFNIREARSVILENFKIDAANIVGTTPAIYIVEASDNTIFVNNITIVGSGADGYGISIGSPNCRIENCNISSMLDGIVATDEHCIITGNICNSNSNIGIFLNTVDYITVQSNTCRLNQYGIYLTSANKNLILGNTVEANTADGIYLNNSDQNTFEGNIIDGNITTNVGTDHAGITLSNSLNNFIIGNTIINNTNGGAGEGYGIYLVNAACIENIVRSNTISGNDIQWKDVGVNSDFEYRCSTNDEIQDAIDSIAGKAGVIKIVGAIADVQATINNATASIVIEGDGEISELDANGDNTVLTITNCASLILRDFKIDATDITTNGRKIVDIGGGDNILLDNLIMIGDGTHGYGINITVNNEVEVRDCKISTVNAGILARSDGNRIIGNFCYGCYSEGIFVNGDQNLVNNNICNENIHYGIDIYSGANYNTITGNVCNKNNLNHADDGAGIHIRNNSNYNIISGNTMYGNVNAGAGTAYGIYIHHADCDFNSIVNNNYSGNDINWKDVGTNTEIEYRCNTGQEIQDAINSIAAKAGVIKIVGSFNVDAAINVNLGGDYIIEGEGAGTVLTTVGDITCINITSARSCLLQNFKIDASSLTTLGREIIDITEAADNMVIINNVEIIGDGTNGYGVEINSDNCRINNCNFTDISRGISINDASLCFITKNYFDNADIILEDTANFNSINNNNGISYKIFLDGSIGGCVRNLIYGNTMIISNDNGIHLYASNDNIIANNIITATFPDEAFNIYGILIDNCDYTLISANKVYLIQNIGVGIGYGLYINNAASSVNIISGNFFNNNNINYVDNGTGTILFGDDTAYGAGWNGDKGTPTKDAIYDYFGIGWSGWFDDGVNFRITVVNGMITAVANSAGAGHNP